MIKLFYLGNLSILLSLLTIFLLVKREKYGGWKLLLSTFITNVSWSFTLNLSLIKNEYHIVQLIIFGFYIIIYFYEDYI